MKKYLVILNLFQDPLKGPRVKGKRFRNKFGMTETERGPKHKKILCGCDHKKLGQQPTKKKRRKNY